MNEEPFDPWADPPRREWRFPFTWLGLLAICFILYELTHQPALASVAICLKFGWEDFLAARWLYRTDTNRARAYCCGMLYMAWGFWKTGLVAMAMSIGFLIVELRRDFQGGKEPLALFATFWTTLLAFFWAWLLTGAAARYARRASLLLWLDRAVHRARRHDVWPPSLLCEGRTNRLGQLAIPFVMITGVMFGMLFCGVFVGLIALINNIAGQPGAIKVVVVWVFLGLVALGVILMLQASVLLFGGFRAKSPYDCWPEVPGRPAQWGEPVA
jgi:hypothetical protein